MVRSSQFIFITLTELHSEPTVLTSTEEYVFVALPGRPLNDPTWDTTTAGVEAAFRKAEVSLRFSKRRDRRGRYNTVASGISYGVGQKVRYNTLMLESLTMLNSTEAWKS